MCYFGIYRDHPRNTIFLNALRKAGHTVTEIVTHANGLSKYVWLARQLSKRRDEFDVVMVGFPGQQAVLVAKLFFRGPVIFNALLSLHDSIIGDRRRYAKLSFRALYFWLVDYLSAHAADVIILDCNAYIDYFVTAFHIKREKCIRIFLGSEEEKIHKIDVPEIDHEIHYYSSYIPTHGVETIIRAAKILENSGIRFILSGRGQCYVQNKKLADELAPKNLALRERFGSLEELNVFLNSSWITLGLFANMARADRCISSKVFEAMNCGKAIVTGNARAVHEILEDQRSVLLVELDNPQDLADKILLLKRDENLRKNLGAEAKKAYDRGASQRVIMGQLTDCISVAVGGAKV